ncbi:DUF5017 domain-containing protein [Mucilaginibacter terrae]|uniref:DUF5017 domain-containing protein n=1 Tax=Mucilaginibacter terrae TaxID=1955052 RepID=UPI00363A555F
MKKILLPLLAVALLATACNKVKLKQPDFNAETNKLTFKVGDTVRFNLSGTADYIYFFSGEVGSEYEKRSEYMSPVNGKPEFEFTSNVQFGTATNNLSVLVSSNFSGINDAANISKATWTDVTSRAVLGTSATNLASGVISVNDLAMDSKPLYVAFKYLSNSPETLKQRQWTVGGFKFRSIFNNGKITTLAADNVGGAFTSVDLNGGNASWVVNSSNLSHLGLDIGLPADEDWAISKAFDLKKITADAANVITIKTASTGFVVPQFTYIYTTPGTYKATFAVRNANADGVEESLKEITITVTP